MTASTRQSTLQCAGFRIGAGLFAMLLCCGQARAGEIDTQLWSEIKLTSHWTDQFDVVSAFATRFGEDVSHHDRTSVYLGLNVHLTPTLTLTPGYQYISTDLLDDVLSHEHRFNIIAALRLPVERFETTLSTASETLDFGVDLGSLVSRDYAERRPFKFDGKIGTVKVDLK